MEKLRILIVDDHRVVIEGIKSALSGHPGFAVVGEAMDGRQAVRMVGEVNPDVIVMDIAMPGLNGIDATLQIRKRYPDIRIIVFTMYAYGEFAVDLRDAGVNGYLLKEEPMSFLIHALEAARDGGTFFSARVPVFDGGAGSDEPTEGQGGFDTLSLREREVFQLLAEGKSVKEAAAHLHISPKTVESHKYNIMAKLKLDSIADLVKLAIKKRIVPI